MWAEKEDMADLVVLGEEVTGTVVGMMREEGEVGVVAKPHNTLLHRLELLRVH
jgi:sRNA-binding carbon storage regulator CsrA